MAAAPPTGEIVLRDWPFSSCLPVQTCSDSCQSCRKLVVAQTWWQRDLSWG